MVCHATGFVLALLDEQLEIVCSATCPVRSPCCSSLSVLCPLISALCSPIAAPCSLLSAFCFLLCVLEITARMSHNWTTQCSCVSPCDETNSLFRVETCMLPSCASLHSTGDAKIVDFKYHDVDLVTNQLTIQLRGTNKDLCIRVSSRPHIALQILDCICSS